MTSSRPAGLLTLTTDKLWAPVESSRLAPPQRHALSDKVRHFQSLLTGTKAHLDQEYRLFQSGHPKPDAAHLDRLRAEQQESLDKVRTQLQTRLNQLHHKFEQDWGRDPRMATQPPGPQWQGADTRFLVKALGDTLQKALAEVCERRPLDPIEYLALWLKKHAENERNAQKEALLSLMKRLEEEEAMEQRDREKLVGREAAQIKAEQERRKRLFEQRLGEVAKSMAASQPIVEPDASATRSGDVTTESGDVTAASCDVTHPIPEEIVEESPSQSPDGAMGVITAPFGQEDNLAKAVAETDSQIATSTLYTIEEKDSEGVSDTGQKYD